VFMAQSTPTCTVLANDVGMPPASSNGPSAVRAIAMTQSRSPSPGRTILIGRKEFGRPNSGLLLMMTRDELSAMTDAEILVHYRNKHGDPYMPLSMAKKMHREAFKCCTTLPRRDLRSTLNTVGLALGPMAR
jgi:hypothetical protein